MADNEDVYSSKVFTFLVGHQLKSFYAHKALISKHSKPLDRLMNADMKEKEQMCATLPDVEPGTFARFLEWAYKGYYTPAPHTMDEMPPALSEVNGIKKEQKEFAGMFSGEPLFTNSRHDEGDRLTPRAASLLQPEAPTRGNPPAPFRLPLTQPATAAPVAPTATVPAAGIFGTAAAPPGNTTTAAGTGLQPATAAPVAPTATAPTGGLFGSAAAPPGNTTTAAGTGVQPAAAAPLAPTATASTGGLFGSGGVFGSAAARPSNTTTAAGTGFQPAAAAPLAPTATASTGGLFGSAAAPPSTNTTTAGAGVRPASANSAPIPAISPFSFGPPPPLPTTSAAASNPTPTPASNDRSPFSFATSPAPTSTTSTSSSMTATATTSQNPFLDPSRPAAANGSTAATGTSASAFGSTRPASASSTSNTDTNTTGGASFGSGFGSRPAPTSNAPAFGSTTSSASAFGSTTTPAAAANTSTGGLFGRSTLATAGGGLFGSNPAPSSNTNSSSIFASRATPAFGGFGAPPTAPSALTQPTGLFGRSPSPSDAPANRRRSPSPFAYKESNSVFGNTSSTQRPPFGSAKDQLKEAFISRKPKVLSTLIEIPPPRGNWPGENHTDVLLSHAQLYVFADEQDIQSLKTLALESLHAALSLFFLYPGRTNDIISLLRYSYDNTADYEGHRDELRELLTQYMGLEMEILVKDMGLRDLMTKDDDGIGQEERAALLGDFMGVVAKRL